MSSFLKDLRDAQVAALASFPLLNGEAIISRQVGDIQSAIDQALNANLGRCIVVFTPVIKKIENGARGPFFREVLCRIKCMENPLLNTAPLAPDAETLAEYVFQALHLQQFDLPGCETNPLTCASPATEDEGLHAGTLREIDCLFETSGGLDETPDLSN